AVGAPSLRSSQGRVAMQPTQPYVSSAETAFADAFVASDKVQVMSPVSAMQAARHDQPHGTNCIVPALAKAQGRGTHSSVAGSNTVPERLPLRIRSWFPPFANYAKDGAPTVLVIPAKSKVWATRVSAT